MFHGVITHNNQIGQKPFFGPVNKIPAFLFESIRKGYQNCGELEGFDHLVCQEISERIINFSITNIWAY